MHTPKKSIFVLFICFCFLVCIVIFPNKTNAQTTISEAASQEARWRAELAETEREIARWEAILNQTRRGTASLQRDASILQAKINEARAFIRQRQLQIEQLTRGINEKNKTINELENKIDRGRESLASILRNIRESDSISLVEIFLSDQTLSDFFINIDKYQTINLALGKQFNEIRDLQLKTDEEKKALDQKRREEADKKAEIERENMRVVRDEAEKRRLININRTQERTYQEVIRDKQRQAAQIRAALFALRDTDGIPFGDALAYANEASKLTGVRPAFILGILQQESNIGRNVGSCVITDLESGRTQNVNTGRVFNNGIHPTRDLPVLQDVLRELGKDPKTTRVSCPLSIGFGGAMGPAQFIPSTWRSYIDRLRGIFGVLPDPWNPRHSIIASALLLDDLGASAGGHSAEHRAAAQYFAGRNWRTLGQGYATSVLNHARNIQVNMIDPLEGF